MSEPFFTVGHSTRSVAELADILCASGVAVVVDVRTITRSRANPQFNQDSLPAALAPFGLEYQHIAELGGLRPNQFAAADSPNGFWRNRSFRNYADYALGDAFHRGLDRLRETGRRRRCAVMCAEAVWWRCHRRIIADYLIAGGDEVFHLMGRGNVVRATLTPAAVPRDSGLVYPAAAPTPG